MREVLQDRQGIGHRHFQQIGDRVAVVLHRQRFLVVALAAADFAEDVDVGQEVHLDAALAFALAGFAASAGHVEGEASGLVATLARFRQHGEEIANLREDAGVGRGIRTRRAANRRLVNANDFVDVLDSGDRLVLTGLFARTIEPLRQRAVEDVIHQRGFARAGHAGDNRHHAQREGDVEILEVVFRRAEDGDRIAVGVAALRTHLDLHFAGDVLAGERIGIVHDFIGRA